MNRLLRVLVLPLLILLLAGVATAQTPVRVGHVYELTPESTFQQGCFPPCRCFLAQAVSLDGRFALVPAGREWSFRVFEIPRIAMKVQFYGDEPPIEVHGSGVYRVRGGDSPLQQLELDLQVGDAPVEHFDSGLVPAQHPLREIDITIDVNDQHCWDQVFTLRATPRGRDRSLRLLDDVRRSPKATTESIGWGVLKSRFE